MYEKVLVPLDGSALAELALSYAGELAGRLGSEVTLLNVTESEEAQDYNQQQIYIQQMVDATKYDAEKYLEKQGGGAIKVVPVILVGRAAEEIMDYASKENIDLIIMATHGRSGISRWALGSVADKVVRASKQPVALIRAKDARSGIREGSMLNKLLVPLDGSKESETVIPYIEELASKLKTDITLLQVLAQAYHAQAVGVGGEGVAQIPYTEKEMEPIKVNTESYLQKISRLLRSKGIATKIELRVGTEAEEIINFADELNMDMVAMSTHGRSGISRWTFGSVADKVLHGGNTPVLLVRVPKDSTE